VNQLFALSLAANLVFAQTAVVRDSWFGIDKIKHFFMSAFIESVSYSVLQAAHVKRRPALTSAIGVAAAVGVAREIHDKRTPGKWFSYQDLTWDALGIGAGAAMLTHTVK
jgi:putative lipoprotein